MTDHLPYFEFDHTAWTTARVNRKYVYAAHGNARRFHRAHSALMSWSYGRLARTSVRAECGVRLYAPVLTDIKVPHLEPCPRCYPVTINVTTATFSVSAGAA